MKTARRFCTCEDTSCDLHPMNHELGCDLCIQKNLQLDEIPSCFFKNIHKDLSDLETFKTKNFVEFYLKHHKS